MHLHVLGAFHADDVLQLGKTCYREVDWTAYITAYRDLYGINPDPQGVFERALGNDPKGFETPKHLHVYGPQDSGDFARWKLKRHTVSS